MMHRIRNALSTACVLVSAVPLIAAEGPTDFAVRAKAKTCVDKGLAYLLACQGGDGAWQAFDKPHPAITSLAVKAIADDADHGPKHAAAVRGTEFVLTFVQPDGGIYRPDDGQPNYQTSVALMALAAMKNPKYDKAIKNAQTFLVKIQWDEGEGYEANHPWYGGQGYGKHKRPDLSNTQMMVEALRESGLPPDDPAYQKALRFISRSQMLAETNDQPFAKGMDSGGFIYTPANHGESMAGAESIDGDSRLRSYGSMTYAGFKSMLYAEVKRDDVRVQKALSWIRRHYTLDANPNMPEKQSREGLFYFYLVFAKAMQAWNEPTITDDRGVPHPWRSELVDKLGSLQRPDGSWVNEADRWFEGNAHLVTAYAVLAMQTTIRE